MHLDERPAKADVVIAFDSTDSMDAAIADAKADATTIVNDLEAARVRFAVVEFRDGQPFDPTPEPVHPPQASATTPPPQAGSSD